MNNFNNVFSAVKSYCNNSAKDTTANCFVIIANDSNVPVDKLIFYLDVIQDMGLIRFSWDDRIVYLTSFGTNQEQLFTG